MDDDLPLSQRLALTYAPAAARVDWRAVLGLDARLAAIVGRTTEPVLGQLRLAWWREQLAEGRTVPGGEPQLAVLSSWEHGRCSLCRLVDGWEGLLVGGGSIAKSLQELAIARGEALAALGGKLGLAAAAQEISCAGKEWALVDLALGSSEISERQVGLDLAAEEPWRRPVLPSAMRPLKVLHGLARRALVKRKTGLLESPRDLAAAVRIGLLGW